MNIQLIQNKQLAGEISQPCIPLVPLHQVFTECTSNLCSFINIIFIELTLGDVLTLSTLIIDYQACSDGHTSVEIVQIIPCLGPQRGFV